MTGRSPGPAVRRLGYTRSIFARPWRPVFRFKEAGAWRNARNAVVACRIVAGMAAILWVAGCSTPDQVGFFGWDDDYGDTTGAIATALSGTPSLVSSADLGAASTAAVALFDKKDGRTSASWENSSTGARGTITAVAGAYRDGGAECHDFLASYVHDAKEAWFQGAVCRTLFGRFAVRDIKPWRRS